MQHRNLTSISAAALVAAAVSSAAAAVPVRLEKDQGRVELRPSLELATDPSGSWTVSDVADGHAAGERLLEGVFLGALLAMVALNLFLFFTKRAQRTLLAEREEQVAALRRLVSGVAHEIGNPLNFGAGGARELARPLGELETAVARGELSETLARSVKKAVAAAGLVRTANERIQNIIENLRTYVGQRRAPVQPVELHHEVHKTLQLLADRTERNAIEVVARVDPFPPYPCVPGELGQVFLNLGMNAIQAMPDGGILTVEGKSSDEWLEISVSDTGPGIPTEQQAIIFDAFFTTRGPDEGTGLGLSVSREIVRRHGGELLLAPTQQGAKFVVRLPRSRAQAPMRDFFADLAAFGKDARGR